MKAKGMLLSVRALRMVISLHGRRAALPLDPSTLTLKLWKYIVDYGMSETYRATVGRCYVLCMSYCILWRRPTSAAPALWFDRLCVWKLGACF